MATPTTTQVMRLSAEEIGYLTAGPGRAAETVLARLLDAGAVRVSRDGHVTAVQQNGYQATTSVEARILSYASTPIRFDTIVQSTAHSQEMAALHQYLLGRKLVQRPRRRNEGWWLSLVVASGLFLLGFSTPVLFLGVPIAVLFFLWQRGRTAVTRTGKESLAQVTASDRVHAVALYGFCGKVNGQAVGDLFELPQSIVKMLPLKAHSRKRSSSTGYSSCGSSCSSCGSGCGSSSCSSSSSNCSSGGSSCSSGSSCGSGCGGGGGGD